MERLFVGGLDKSTTRDALVQRFRSFGNVKQCEIIVKGQIIQKESVFAYIDLIPKDKDSISNLISLYNKSLWKGQTLRVERAKPSDLKKLQADRQLEQVTCQLQQTELKQKQKHKDAWQGPPQAQDYSMQICLNSKLVKIDRLGSGNIRRYFPLVKFIPLNELVWEIPERQHKRVRMQQEATIKNKGLSTPQQHYSKKQKTYSVDNEIFAKQPLQKSPNSQKQAKAAAEKEVSEDKSKPQQIELQEDYKSFKKSVESSVNTQLQKLHNELQQEVVEFDIGDELQGAVNAKDIGSKFDSDSELSSQEIEDEQNSLKNPEAILPEKSQVQQQVETSLQKSKQQSVTTQQQNESIQNVVEFDIEDELRGVTSLKDIGSKFDSDTDEQLTDRDDEDKLPRDLEDWRTARRTIEASKLTQQQKPNYSQSLQNIQGKHNQKRDEKMDDDLQGIQIISGECEKSQIGAGNKFFENTLEAVGADQELRVMMEEKKEQGNGKSGSIISDFQFDSDSEEQFEDVEELSGDLPPADLVDWKIKRI